MPVFSDLDKKVMRLIAEMDVDSPKVLGELVTPIIFKTKQSALFIDMDVDQHGFVLLGKAKGGFKVDHESRNNLISLISLIQFLEKKRFVLTFEENIDFSAPTTLFYEDAPSFYNLNFDFPGEKEGRYNKTYLKRHKCALLNEAELKISISGITEEKFDSMLIFALKEDRDKSVNKAEITYPDGSKLINAWAPQQYFPEIRRIMFSTPFPSQSLKEFVKNDFKTQDEISTESTLAKMNVQIKWAIIAVIIAVIPAFVGFINWLWDSLSSPIHKVGLCIVTVSIAVILLVAFIQVPKVVKTEEQQ